MSQINKNTRTKFYNFSLILVILLIPFIQNLFNQSFFVRTELGHNTNLSHIENFNSSNSAIFRDFQQFKSDFFFQKNIGNIPSNLTYFSYHTKNSFVKFQNSSISINLDDNNSIIYSLFGAKDIIPVSSNPRQISENYYYQGKRFTNFEFSELIYYNIYEKIDLVYYITNEGLKYNFIIHPGGNPDIISFNISTNLSISYNIDSVNFYHKNMPSRIIFRDSNLYSYQSNNNKIESTFKQTPNISCRMCYGFKLGLFDKNKDLIIDPYWVINTNDIKLDNNKNVIQANGMDFDSKGNIVVLGQVLSKTTGYDLFLSKYAKNGSNIASTYISGSSDDSIEIDQFGKSIQIDSDNNIYITGYTNSTDLIKNPILPYNGSKDVFLIKLNSELEMTSGTYLGGSLDDKGRSVAIYNNSVFLSGVTASLDFPVKNSFGKNFNGGTTDIFIAKFSNNLKLIFSTYYGGNNVDEIHASEVDKLGNIIITGQTTSTNLNTTKYAFQQNIQTFNSPDAFVAKISNNGQNLLLSSYYGGKYADEGNDVVIDSENNIWIIGTTESSELQSNFVHTYISNSKGSSGVFIICIKELTLIQFESLDGDLIDTGISMTFDAEGNILFTGNSYSYNFWNHSTQITPSGFNNISRGYITKIDRQTGEITMSSIIKMSCPFVYCRYTSQQILINEQNDLYFLGNNYYNNIGWKWIPIFAVISSENDKTAPKIELPGYSVGKTYRSGSNLHFIITDDISGINKVTYRWNNGSPIILNEPYVIDLKNLSSNNILTIIASDKAGNVATSKEYNIILTNENYSSIILVIGTVGLSILSAYIAIHIFWKYYFSKKRVKKQENLHPDEVRDYLEMAIKNPSISDVIKDKKR